MGASERPGNLHLLHVICMELLAAERPLVMPRRFISTPSILMLLFHGYTRYANMLCWTERAFKADDRARGDEIEGWMNLVALC